MAGLVGAVCALPMPARAVDEAAASNLALAIDLCLQNVRGRDAVDDFRAAGFTVTPMDEGTFGVDAYGVEGWLAPLLVLGWCWMGSERLPYQDVARIAHERALFRFPQGVSGPPERAFSSELVPNARCAGFNVAHANRVFTLVITNAPHWEGCDDPATGGVEFN